MSNVIELVQRADRLSEQAERLRREIDDLRSELLKLGLEADGKRRPSSAADQGCLAVAISLAQDLGPEFSSDNPHDLSGRGTNWFANG